MNLGTVDFRNVEDLSENKYMKAGRYTAYVTEAKASLDGSGEQQIEVVFKNSREETIKHWFTLSNNERRLYGLQLTKKFLSDAGNDMSNFSGIITSNMIVKKPVIIIVGYKEPNDKGKYYTKLIATEQATNETIYEINETEEARIKHLRKHNSNQNTGFNFGVNDPANNYANNDFDFDSNNSFDISDDDLPF